MTAPWDAGPHGDQYATWDAAYVLGSLSAGDRRVFEAHLADCPSCRDAVTELSGMPALLSQLGHDEVTATDEADRAGTALRSSEMLPVLLDKVRRRRRRSRLLAFTAAAAAAVVLAIGVFIAVGGHTLTPEPTPPGLPMAQVATEALVSTVSLHSEQWGTFITMDCVCLAPPNAPQDKLAMVVVGRDGSRSQLATWVAHPGHTAMPAASTSTPTDQIAAVQVVSADNGQVLLQRSL